MDKVNKSIFMANLHKIVRFDDRFTFITCSIKTSLVNAPGVKKQVKKEVERISQRWCRRRRSVYVDLVVKPKATESIMSKLDSTTRWGRRAKSELG